MIRAIVATDKRLGIGLGGKMPWPHHHEDMAWFRENTEGGVVVMGRKTWESIGCRNLPRRINVLVTTRDTDSIRWMESVSRDELPHWIMEGPVPGLLSDCARMYHDQDVWVIGGANLYRQALPHVSELYLTTFPIEAECDAFLDKRQVDEFSVVKRKKTLADGVVMEVRSRP